MPRFVYVLWIATSLLAAGCGGSSHSSSNNTANISIAGGNTIVTSGNNVAPLTVDAGPVPTTNPQTNVSFTTVVVCAPGFTTNCVTIPDVSVDTASTGLRIPASLLSSLSLSNVNPSAPVAKCVQFLDNTFLFGSVKVADVYMGGSNNIGEVAASLPIHVIGDTSVPTGASIPSDCSGGGTGTEEDSVTALGANGRLGVGAFQYDCDVLGYGNLCTSGTPPPATYYTCSNSTTCTASTVPTSQQVRNPVSKFATDNNGVIVELPAVALGGESGIPPGQGSLVFGIGTQDNNGLSSSAVVLPLDPNPNDPAWTGITTVYNGVSYPHSTSAISSFLDSGSNGLFFLDQPTSGIPACGFWYCPSSTETLTAINQATGGNTRATQFIVGNSNVLFNTGDNAFSDLAGPNTPGTPDTATQAADGYFDWGLSFFYGRNIYISIWQVPPPSTPASGASVPAGPFWAY